MKVNDTTLAIDLPKGRSFQDAGVSAVEDYLRARSVERIELDAAHMRASADGQRLILECVRPGVRQYPMRQSCFEKLLRWHGIPADPVARMGSDVAVAVVNGVLGLIRKGVRLRIEDGDALTVTSQDYTEISDLAVLERCRTALGKATRVTRDDHFMRVIYEDRVKTQPIVGDLCGLGAAVMNSETGFMSLRVSASIYRYVCKNGAVASVTAGDDGMAHYRSSTAALEAYLQRGFAAVDRYFGSIAGQLARSVNHPVGNLRQTGRNLDAILGGGRGQVLMRRFEDQPDCRSVYELFNFITHSAKQEKPWLRLRMEAFAGSLMAGGDAWQRRN